MTHFHLPSDRDVKRKIDVNSAVCFYIDFVVNDRLSVIQQKSQYFRNSKERRKEHLGRKRKSHCDENCIFDRVCVCVFCTDFQFHQTFVNFRLFLTLPQ